MRVLQGTKVVDIGPGWRDRLEINGRRVIVDIGAGDGRWVYERARRDRSALYIGLDPDTDGLKEYAYRASRKASRGGVDNVLYVVASVEQPPEDLLGVADEVHVIFPWAALLRGLLRPDDRVLRGLASLGKPGSSFELVLTYDVEHDHGAGLDTDIPSLSANYVEGVLHEPYRRACLAIENCRQLTFEEALSVPSTWGRRLMHGRSRDVFLVSGTLLQA